MAVWLTRKVVMRNFIPFIKPYVGEEEQIAVLRALELGALGGNGPIGTQLQARLRELLRARHVLLTTSCSHAMEMAAMALRLKPGDEVIMPSFTFVTTASAVVREGARPVFVDIDEATWNMDPAQIEKNITPRTRAIIPVHYAGQGCAMHEIMDIARRHNLYVIEDAAQGLGAKYDGLHLGTIGHVGCFSFHVTKNVICGEGGAFVTNDKAVAERAEIVREKGTNRSKFLRGEVDKYTWVDLGSSFVPSDLLSAVALAQLDKMDEIHRMRQVVWERYQEGLKELEEQGHIILPCVSPKADMNWHIYAFRMVDAKRRNDVLDELKRRSIGATFHYVPLHSSPYARERWGYRPEDLPVTERVAASLVRLPIYPGLSKEEQDYIIASLYDILVARLPDHLVAMEGQMQREV
jgi:dTDP-4-amino-4,6-dideoxygalactose transaminase